jgi:RNA polymerase sigma-70 factor (ECF subfamily)
VTPVNSADDAQLMTRLAGGDKEALVELVQRHQQRVLALAYRLTGDRALAEDLAQEAFLRVWRSAARYRPQARFTTWLYRIVVNLCLDASKKRRPVSGELPNKADARIPPPPAAADFRVRATAVQQAVARLPGRQRVALVLHRFSGLSVQAVAEATGWSESAVESLLVRAYSTLRKSLRNLAGP